MVGSECALEPAPFPPMSSVLGGVLIPDGKRCLSSVNVNSASTIPSPGGVFDSENKRNKEVDINHFHIPLAYAY